MGSAWTTCSPDSRNEECHGRVSPFNFGGDLPMPELSWSILRSTTACSAISLSMLQGTPSTRSNTFSRRCPHAGTALRSKFRRAGRRARCGSSLRPNGAFASPAECRGQGWARGVSISSWANGACGEQRRHDSDRMMLGLRYSTYPPLRRSSARILCSSSLLLRLTRRRARCTGPFLYLRLFMAIALFLS